MQEPVDELEEKEEEKPMQWYHIDVPPPLPGTSSRKDLRAENMLLRDIIRQAGIALEEDYAQMKLMDLENERLRKQLLEKGKKKTQNRLTSGRARHMTAAEHLDLMARQDWESGMKDVFKEVAPKFRILKKRILEYQKAIVKAKKAAEREARKAATAAAQARGRGRGTGSRGGRRGRGTRGRGTGRGAGAAGDSSDSGSDPSGSAESSESHSDSDSESEAEVPIPRSRRQRPVRVIQGRHEYAAEEVRDEPIEQAQPHPRPRPRPRMPNRLPESQDDQEEEVSESGGRDTAAGDESGTLQGESGQRRNGNGIGSVPVVVEGSLEGQGGGIEAPAEVQPADIETQVGPPRRRNPRRKN